MFWVEEDGCDWSGEDEVVAEASDDGTFYLPTPVTPARANHSYNGVLFEVEVPAKALEEVVVQGIVCGGEIGRFQIFLHRGQRMAELSRQAEYRWSRNWEKISEGELAADWRGLMLPLHNHVRIAPGEAVVFYVHSSLENDLGIAYQSYSTSRPIVADDNISIYPGYARIGSIPFDDEDMRHHHAWWRPGRGLAGGIQYRCIRKQWSCELHMEFPSTAFRTAVFTFLMIAQLRPESLPGQLPTEALWMILEQLDWRDWPRDDRVPSRRRSIE